MAFGVVGLLLDVAGGLLCPGAWHRASYPWLLWDGVFDACHCSSCWAGVGVVVVRVDEALTGPSCLSLLPLLWLLLIGLPLMIEPAVPCPGESAPD